MCALGVADAEQAAAACDSHPGCTGFGLLAATIAPVGQSTGAARIAILKSAMAVVPAWHLTYSPLSTIYLKEGRASPPQLPADPATANGVEPPRAPGERSASFNVLRRPQAELRALSDGCELGLSLDHSRLRIWLGCLLACLPTCLPTCCADPSWPPRTPIPASVLASARCRCDR